MTVQGVCRSNGRDTVLFGGYSFCGPSPCRKTHRDTGLADHLCPIRICIAFAFRDAFEWCKFAKRSGFSC